MYRWVHMKKTSSPEAEFIDWLELIIPSLDRRSEPILCLYCVLVIENIKGHDNVLNHLSIPAACFTHPEISMVGLTEVKHLPAPTLHPAPCLILTLPLATCHLPPVTCLLSHVSLSSCHLSPFLIPACCTSQGRGGGVRSERGKDELQG